MLGLEMGWVRASPACPRSRKDFWGLFCLVDMLFETRLFTVNVHGKKILGVAASTEYSFQAVKILHDINRPMQDIDRITKYP